MSPGYQAGSTISLVQAADVRTGAWTRAVEPRWVRCRWPPRVGNPWPLYTQALRLRQSSWMLTRESLGEVPDAPGSYQFRDRDHRIIYVGKARSLRQRLSSYFQDPAHLAPRTVQMLSVAESVEWIQVRNDVEALMLEYNLIKVHKPRFNVRLMDGKSYPYLAVTLNHEWPRAAVVRGAKRKGVRYFGPYAHPNAIRETFDLLLKSFPVRTCSDAKLVRHSRLGRPCLLFHIKRCCGPCVGKVSHDEYSSMLAEFMAFLDGDSAPVVKRLASEMNVASRELRFEAAARARDRLESVLAAVETQEMVASAEDDLDVIGVAEDELEAAVQVFFIRSGRVVGRNGFILDKVEEISGPQVVAQALEQFYAQDSQGGQADATEVRDPGRSASKARPGNRVPATILVGEEPEDMDLFVEWLSGIRGSRIVIKVPRRGGKRRLLETVSKNANEALHQHRLRRASDHNARARALNALQEALGLAEAPLRIECFDMSHLQGTDYVGSMVVMEDALAKRSEYRRFKVSTVAGNDDYAAMAEVLRRRLSRLDEPRSERSRQFAYPPQLLLLDGGKGQLSVGTKVLRDLGLEARIPVAALAKSFEEVFVPGRGDPICIPRSSEALYLLQQIRDEAHRFAIEYHRKLRSTRMKSGFLDGVSGLGEVRRRRLLAEIGGASGLRAASLDDLLALPWLPDRVARDVYDQLHARA